MLSIFNRIVIDSKPLAKVQYGYMVLENDKLRTYVYLIGAHMGTYEVCVN